MTAMNLVAPPRISRCRAAAITVAGLTAVGALVGALWAWLAPSIHGVVALTKRGERVKGYLGNEASTVINMLSGEEKQSDIEDAINRGHGEKGK